MLMLIQQQFRLQDRLGLGLQDPRDLLLSILYTHKIKKNPGSMVKSFFFMVRPIPFPGSSFGRCSAMSSTALKISFLFLLTQETSSVFQSGRELHKAIWQNGDFVSLNTYIAIWRNDVGLNINQFSYVASLF